MKKKAVLITYLVLILLVGVFFVPYNIVWQHPDHVSGYFIEDISYAPIWSLIDNKSDNFMQLQITKLLYTVFIVTLIFRVLYLLVDKKRE